LGSGEDSHAKRFWCVERFSMADALSRAERNALHERMKFTRYQSGQTVYLPGDLSDTVYSVREGCIHLAYLDERGRRLTFSIVKRGQVFGETALMGETKRRWIAEAIEDSTLCIVAKADLLRFAQGNPRFALNITKIVGRRMVEIENKLEDLLFKSVSARLSHTLLRLVEKFGLPDPLGTRIDLKLTHQDLASLIGATRETTSTALGRFERQGLIAKGHSRIVVKDAALLGRVK